MDIYQEVLWGDAEKQAVKKKKKYKKPISYDGKRCAGRVLMLGAGVQSSTMDMILFGDTGNEPEWVYKQLEYLKKRVEVDYVDKWKLAPIPFLVVQKDGTEGIQEDAFKAHRFPTMPVFTKNTKTGKISMLRRQCTNDYKIQPVDDAVRTWLMQRGLAKRDAAGRRIVSRDIYIDYYMGISTDEAERQAQGRVGWKRLVYPLIENDMSREDCHAYLHEHNLPIPKKSSCKICLYHENMYWYALSTEHPSVFEEVCCFDDGLRDGSMYFTRQLYTEAYLHRSGVPLRDIDFAALVAEERRMRQLAKNHTTPMFKLELLEGRKCASDGGFSCMS